ncbi:MAG: ABC-F family ATP-binding cassette domain-containing protein [Thermomicrobiales bacterium]
MAILIQAANLSWAYGGNQIFDNLSFELKSGERIALIGENGSGKSSLFRLLAKQEKPFKGAVTHMRGLTIGYLTQDVRLDPAKTPITLVGEVVGTADAIGDQLAALEAKMAEPLSDDELADVIDQYNALLAREDEVMTANNASDAGDRVLDILIGLGLPETVWEQPFATLSGGEKKLVGIARFLTEQPDVLLLDEPDNHLDVRAKRWLEDYLVAYPGAVGIITHDRYLIDRVATEIVELEDGKVATWPGNYTAFQEQKQAKIERTLALREIQEREVQRLKESSEEITQWARQNPKFASRAENMRRRYQEEKAKLEATPAPRLARDRIKVAFDASRGSTLVAQAEGVSKSFGERRLLQPFDLTVRHGERIGIVGPNGAGKTTFIRMLLGQEKPTEGTLRIGASIVPGYYAQEHESLDPDMAPIDWVRRLKPLNEQQALSALVAFTFDRTDAFGRIGDLSGGERSRLQIAGLILTGANFLILDEPTNNLDIPSVEELERALLEFDGTIVTISHDRYFLDRIGTRIVEFRDGQVRDWQGNYTEYIQHPEIGTPLTRQTSVPEPALSAKKVKARAGV